MTRVCFPDNIRCKGANRRDGRRVGLGGDEFRHGGDGKNRKSQGFAKGWPGCAVICHWVFGGRLQALERATGHRGPLLEEIRNSRLNVIKCYLLIAEILARLVPFTCTPSPPTSKE